MPGNIMYNARFPQEIESQNHPTPTDMIRTWYIPTRLPLLSAVTQQRRRVSLGSLLPSRPFRAEGGLEVNSGHPIQTELQLKG
ncbi:hypothetical protein VTJ04DRAFT_10134 [Mycothermus thermophilus]|uniref:uncharacterized protein n=1 Tax=Humicola insolens TaxID=85995 RepID=UPI0037439EF6